MRGNTNDTYTYYFIFKNVDSYDLMNYSDFYSRTGVEVGWGLYSKIISLFSNSEVVLFTIFSLLTFYFIYKTSDIIKLKFIYVMCFYLPTGFFFDATIYANSSRFCCSCSNICELSIFGK